MTKDSSAVGTVGNTVRQRFCGVLMADPLTPPCSNYSSAPVSRSQSPLPLPGSKYKPLKDRVQERTVNGEIFFSYEFFPPRTANGAVNLMSKMEKMACTGPLFCDITWHAAGNPGSSEPTSSITCAMAMINHCGIDTMLHITCCNQTKDQITRHLNRARDMGCSNVLLLRGDPPEGEEWQMAEGGFAYATDLVRHVRDNYGDFFTIAVAAYPKGHPECTSYEDDLAHLKVKVDAGADFIITQLFFEADTFINFVKDCRRVGINCPIIPGILPIQGYQSLRHITKLGGLQVPQAILDIVEPIKDNDAAVRKFGIEFGVEMCKKILDSKATCGLHFYTLNREIATVQIVERLGFSQACPMKPFPWKPTANFSRYHEDVRPIFWASRPKSYVARTSDWDEYPNGRWGNTSAAAFRNVTDHHKFYVKCNSTKAERLDMWGQQLFGEEDVWQIFHSYISGQPNSNGIMVTKMPWNDDELASETKLISAELAQLNLCGVLTINSQPPANGESSTHPVLGWGLPGGYVYQKAYLEFFVSPSRAEALREILPKYTPRVNYHIINCTGEDVETNCDSREPIAVTWGVFPGKEIVQPTVVDPIAFTFWKDEAFSLWRDSWGSLYAANSRSRKIINHIVGTYYLVNLVDNNFPEPSILWQICDEMIDVSELKKRSKRFNGVITSQARPRSCSMDIQYDQWPVKVRTVGDGVEATEEERRPTGIIS